MKKMAIVPFRVLEEMNRWKAEHRPKLPPNPQVAQTAQLQKDMNSILEQHDLSESEKSQQFGETLQKFQLAHKKAVQPQAKLVQGPMPSHEDQRKPMNMQERILESVPTTMRRKAKLLLQMLDQHPHMSWNEQGVLEVHGKPIPGSNMIDLVNDVLRHRKGSNPRGWEQFSHGLRDINVPQEYVGNKQRWSWMQRRSQEEEEEYDTDSEGERYFETSAYIPPTPPSRKAIKRESKAGTSQSWEPY